MNILTELNPTSITVELNTQTCTKKYQGPLYEDLLMLSKMLKFTMNINPRKREDRPIDWRYVTKPENTSDEIKRLIIDNSADMVAGWIAVSNDVYELVDISASNFYQSVANIISVEPLKLLKFFAMFSPYKWYIWMVLLGTVPLCGFVLYFLRKFSKNPDKKASLGNALWDVSAIICWESAKFPNPPPCISILLSSYMLTMLLVITDYLGRYTSSVVTPGHRTEPIETVNDFLMSDMEWIGGRMATYYLDLFSDVDNMQERLIKISSDENEVKKALEKLLEFPEEYVYFEKQGLVEWSVCYDSLHLQNRSFFYSKETIGDYNTYLYFRKGSEYTEAFNRKILLLQDMGIIYQNHRWFLTQNGLKRCQPEENNELELIKLEHFAYGFIIMAIGYGLALISLFKEAVKGITLKMTFREIGN